MATPSENAASTWRMAGNESFLSAKAYIVNSLFG